MLGEGVAGHCSQALRAAVVKPPLSRQVGCKSSGEYRNLLPESATGTCYRNLLPEPGTEIRDRNLRLKPDPGICYQNLLPEAATGTCY